MKAIWCVLLALLFKFTEQATTQRDVCPHCSQPDKNFHFGSYRILKYSSGHPILRFGDCITYNSTTKSTEYHYGPCPYIAHYTTTTTEFIDTFYIQLPSNVSLLNEYMCGPLNREGPLCGKCKDGYGIALYSYTLECSKCWEHGYGWVLYYFLELFPITVMYFLVVIFHITATSSPLSALVFMSQIVVYTIRLNVPLHMYIENEVTGFPYVALKVLLVLCGIWSLDFFRSVIPTFCASSNIKTIHAVTLEYVVALYPIFLILMTYLCIKLHDNNFRPVVRLWKPFHRHFVYLRRRWDSTASIINVFTTFLLLSFSKILFVSFILLNHNRFDIDTINHYTNKGYQLPKCVLYYDPTVECYSQEYTIFSTIAICVLVIFIICPTILLILYPTRVFRRCVSCCGFRRWHALHMFVESFQGQYKDGTNGTHDFRMVSASFLILRILILALFLYHHSSTLHIAEMQSVLLLCATCLHAITKPYRLNFMNNVDILILFLLEIFILGTSNFTSDLLRCIILVSTLLLLIPHMVLIFYIFHKLAKKAGITQYLKREYKALKKCMQVIRHTGQTEADVEAQSDTDSLPDRLINPGEYEPLPTTEEHTAAELTEDKEPINEEPRRLIPVYTYGSIS